MCLGEARALANPCSIEAAAATSSEAAAATSSGAGELAAEQEVPAWVLELAASEENKLVAGKGEVSNFPMTACFSYISVV